MLLAAVAMSAILYFDLFRKIKTDPGRIDGSGIIEVTEVDIAAKIAGRIVFLPVDEGDAVRNGQPIAGLSFDELAPQKVSALASLSNAEKSFNRTDQLYRSGSMSKQSYDNALTAYTTAKSQYQYILANIRNTQISSPLDGVVLRKNAERGELAFPGTPILVIADISRPWIKIYIPERSVGLVKLGNRAEIITDSFPDRIFPGKVIAISNKPEFTPKTIQTKEERVKLVFAIKIALENNDGSLKPGMPADASIITGAKQ
jgi:HlyD family secretion protein